MTAIPAAAYTCRMLVDGTLAITVHVEPRNAQAAFSLFGAPGTAVALAALKTDAQQQQAKPKGGPASQWLALRCKEAAFAMWLCSAFGRKWVEWSHVFPQEDKLACIVRDICQVESRADIDNNDAAFQRFETLIRRPYLEATRDG